MLKVLSTKLAVDEADRFNAVAQQQGLSKSGLLKHLVKEYLGDRNEESKTSTNCKLGNSLSLEKRQTPEKCNKESQPPDKQEVLRNGELEQCSSHMHQTGRIQNVVRHVFADKTLLCSSSTAINSQGKASLAKVPDLREAIIKAPYVEQGLLKVKAKTQVKPKVGFGELLFFGLMALGIVSVRKRNSNQKILPEPNYSGYPDYDEDTAAVYRNTGMRYLKTQ